MVEQEWQRSLMLTLVVMTVAGCSGRASDFSGNWEFTDQSGWKTSYVFREDGGVEMTVDARGFAVDNPSTLELRQDGSEWVVVLGEDYGARKKGDVLWKVRKVSTDEILIEDAAEVPDTEPLEPRLFRRQPTDAHADVLPVS